jgi:hypothetical protein
MSPLLAHATHDRQSETHSAPARKPGARSLRIGAQNDVFEREADRVANEVMQDGKIPNWSFGKVHAGHVQRQPATEPSTSQPAAAPQPNNYKEGAEKLGEAFLKTDLGKKLEQAATDDPLVKGATDFFGTLPGKIIAGAAAAGAVSALAATNKALPAQIPEISLDKIRPGLKVKLTYEGPVDHPTKAMVMFSYTPKGEKKKPKETASESYRAGTARMAADMDKFRAEMTYAPGSPQAQQQEADQKATDDWMTQRYGSLPGTGGRPLGQGAGQPSTGGSEQSGSQWSFSPLAHPELDKKLELQPLTTGSGATLQRKCACQEGGGSGECEECREGKALQRQAAGPAESDLAPAIVDQVLTSPGRPLDKATRNYFEPRLGYDLSRIRIHADAQAAESARSVNALAYTVGDRIAFAAGHYSPQSSEGRRLLAHELAHTVQQSYTARAAGVIQRQSAETEESKGPTGFLGKAKYLLKDVGNAVSPDKWKKAEGCLKSLFPSMKSRTFDDWIPKACARSTTKILHSREWDAFGHCWIACEGTRKCGGPQTFTLGMGREVSREWESRHGGPPHDSLTQDISNQVLGRVESVNEGTCFSICDDLHKSGRLNLTAPEATCVECANQGAGEGPCPGAAKTAGAP